MSPLSRHRDGRSSRNPQARQLRRQANELRRQLRRTATNGRNAYATLLAVLAQHAGEVVITKGTLDNVNDKFDKLGFIVVTEKDRPNEFIIRLVEGQDETPAAEETDDETVSDGEPLAEDSPVQEEERLGDGVI